MRLTFLPASGELTERGSEDVNAGADLLRLLGRLDLEDLVVDIHGVDDILDTIFREFCIGK